MATSQNGWSASPDLGIRPLVVAGESFSPGIRDNDDVFAVLSYVAEQVNARVERIFFPGWHEGDEWGFYYRPNANDPTSLSNHSSGTAIDYNATRHPNGVPTINTFTRTQIAEIHKILAEVDHAVRWGGDYTGTPDAMHFEINVSPAALAVVAKRVREGDDPMADYADQLDRIEQQNATILKRLDNDAAIRNKLSVLVKQGRADSRDLKALQDALDERKGK